MTRNIDQMIAEQVRNWTLQRSESPHSETTSRRWPIITISREFGAQGAALAAMIGRHAGFKVWDRDLVQAIAERSGGDERILQSIDEHRRKAIDEAVRGLLSSGPHTNTQYFRTLIRVVQTIATHGKAVIVGRGANFICKDLSVLRLRVVCPEEQRIRNYARRQGITEAEAREVVTRRDAERTDFIRFHFKRDIEEPSDYDLVVNSGTLGLEQWMKVVLLAYEAKTGRIPSAK